MEGPITNDSVIEHVIKKYPKAMGFLVGKGLDCCCGAFNTLEKGAADAGADLSGLLAELNALVSQPDAAAAQKSK